jgi:hypothetical protein
LFFICRGSNGCIPDLLKPGQRPGSAKPGSRPGSAKSSARKYHPPTGKKTRPQSAKEDGVKHTSPSIASMSSNIAFPHG